MSSASLDSRVSCIVGDLNTEIKQVQHLREAIGLDQAFESSSTAELRWESVLWHPIERLFHQ